ncbi:addiction module protein [bacterium]|nr:addiction module protein [bacterium]
MEAAKLVEHRGFPQHSGMRATMADYQSVLDEASQLPLQERQRLIDALAVSLPHEQRTVPSDEWRIETERRANELDAGVVKTERWSAIREHLLETYGGSHAD